MTGPAPNPTLREPVDALLTRLGRLHAARAHLAELADSVGRDGSPATLLAFLETLERDLRLAEEELGRVRAAAAARA
jgi:Flp pilus assembly protein TadD